MWLHSKMVLCGTNNRDVASSTSGRYTARWRSWASCLHTCVPLFTKQYNLVSVVKRRWRSAAGKVTVGLASHRQLCLELKWSIQLRAQRLTYGKWALRLSFSGTNHLPFTCSYYCCRNISYLLLVKSYNFQVFLLRIKIRTKTLFCVLWAPQDQESSYQ